MSTLNMSSGNRPKDVTMDTISDQMNVSLTQTVANASVRNSASSHVPPEILQTIFRHLSFYDLIRCQRVCKDWRAHLPGNDPRLQEALYQRAKFAVSDKHPDTTPQIHLHLEIDMKLNRQPNELPRIAFDIGTSSLRKTSFGKTVPHPVLSGWNEFMPLVNPNFKIQEKHRVCNQLRFFSFDELKQLTDTSKFAGHYKQDGSWRNMFMCFPTVKELKLLVCWPIKETTQYIKDDEGVTLGRFVDLLRMQLKVTEQDSINQMDRIIFVRRDSKLGHDIAVDCDDSDSDDSDSDD
ncbi:hypothetical protein P153DRAFT_199632 [Dothidotthia symphoricarpi CBS 119687]|uniref:F-box domain-containing protein n=1 Tax=Dothidotthia symphoricarpi CBS 119687 TaxID=1392245 RepID=A0A6A6AKG8_9PLEO|nr:uncharacterized protein P153DRAFT_199632 [Dothidotthia symphoricarpi CBS 119687]KAF2131608.1 hypothetical protein P153DRAFT_199632 [Dothidotthia symphoricarpi CBS 119687]